MRTILIALASFLVAAQVVAQPIHGDPQKARYNDPSEWQPISNQCHVLMPGVNPTIGTPLETPAHTHLDLTCPHYLEDNGPVTCGFALTLFHTAGRIGFIWGAMLDTMSFTDPSQSFPIEGDPLGIVGPITGQVTFDPSFVQQVPAHGWFGITLSSRTGYDIGKVVDNHLIVSVYSMLDPTAPEAPIGDGIGQPTQASKCELAGGPFGSNAMEVRQRLPILGPITPGLDWLINPLTYGYGQAQGLPPGTFRMWLDPDLHHGITGLLLHSVDGIQNTNTIEAFPGTIPAGPHKVMFQWEQTSDVGTLTSNMVFNVLVGPGGVAQPADDVPGAVPIITPPALCADPAAVNIGQPLPCVFPPPLPPLLPAGTYTICNADRTKCIDLVVR